MKDPKTSAEAVDRLEFLHNRAVTALIEAIRRYAEEGVPPSQTEIANALGFRGVRAAQYHLDILEQAGYIRRLPGQARGISRAGRDRCDGRKRRGCP